MTNELPKIDLTTFILSISSAAFMGLGIVASPGEEEPQVNLELARQNIDLLELIHDKTRGIGHPKKIVFGAAPFEARMKFIEKQKEAKLVASAKTINK